MGRDLRRLFQTAKLIPFLKSFKRVVKKRPGRREEIEKTLRLLLDDPFNPGLETHKLKGKLSGTWACSVGYDLRIITVVQNSFFTTESQRAQRDNF